MRLFWTIFFLGSMLMIGLDTRERSHAVASTAPATSTFSIGGGDAVGVPTPRP